MLGARCDVFPVLILCFGLSRNLCSLVVWKVFLICRTCYIHSLGELIHIGWLYLLTFYFNTTVLKVLENIFQQYLGIEIPINGTGVIIID